MELDSIIREALTGRHDISSQLYMSMLEYTRSTCPQNIHIVRSVLFFQLAWFGKVWILSNHIYNNSQLESTYGMCHQLQITKLGIRHYLFEVCNVQYVCEMGRPLNRHMNGHRSDVAKGHVEGHLQPCIVI